MPDDRAALAAAGASPADEALTNVFQPEIAAGGAVLGSMGRGIKNFNDRWNAMPSWPERARQVGETATSPNDPRLREMSMEMMVPGGSATRSVGAALGQANKVLLKRATGFHGEDVVNAFEMFGRDGESLGQLMLRVDDPKHLKVGMIGDFGLQAPNRAGASAMRDVLQQIKSMYPQAQTLSGHRVSGARGTYARAVRGEQGSRDADVTINLADSTTWRDEDLMQLLAGTEAPSRMDESEKK